MPAKCEQAINESLFTQMFASDRTQTSMMADEKSPARNSHRYFATKQLISLEMEKNMEKHITAPLKESDIKDLKATQEFLIANGLQEKPIDIESIILK